MKYTYKVEGSAESLYLKMVFDRQLTADIAYAGWDFNKPQINELVTAVSNTPNVVHVGNSANRSGHVRADGHELMVKINPFADNISEVATQIAKKVQRRLAKGESRNRVRYADVETYIRGLNAKTF